MAFKDPGVGEFKIRVASNEAVLESGAAPDPDLVITQSATKFLKSWTGMHDPAEAMQAGQIQMSDFESLGVFGALFPIGKVNLHRQVHTVASCTAASRQNR